MNNEMVLMYLYFLTAMTSGNNDEWRKCFDAWSRFSGCVNSEKYSEIMDKIKHFQKTYKVKIKP